ncbi:CDP-alcohol phosphatidyltransferase family protein [Hydrogenobaculum sp.]|nr:MAG: CDP-alcohol phosphatidyltransferase family protein [Hydrogenobaculum sp.]
MSSFVKSLKPSFEKAIYPILVFLKDKNINPNAISLTGMVVISIGSFFVYENYNRIGAILLLLGGLFDALDGALARFANKSSSFGAFLDSTIDRLSDALPIGAIILFFSKAQDVEGVFLGLLALMFSFMVSYTKARSHSLGVDIPVGVFERTERFGTIVIFTFLGFYKLGLLIVGIGAFYTTLERIFYAKKHLS